MTRGKAQLLVLAVLVLGAAVLSACAGRGVPALAKQERLLVATTTSLYDTGLWGYLEPQFEQRYGAALDIIYAGTGKALEYARRGDVDAIVVHDKLRELEFVVEGYGVERVPIAYNHFVIVGPEDDPAGIRGRSLEQAFTMLMREGQTSSYPVLFVSRGDDSGTHGKEKSVWAEAGYDYQDVQESGDWYLDVGNGMGPTLFVASEKTAYTLSDMGTFLSFKSRLALVPLVEQGDILLNVYSAIAVSPERHPDVNADLANKLIEFLTSPDVQKLIGEYGVTDYGRQLFTPAAGREM